MQRITDPERFKNRLTEARNDKGWLLKQLASEAHIDYSTVKLFSSGIRVPGPDNLKKLATALNVSPEWLSGKTPFKSSYDAWLACFNDPETKAFSETSRLIYQAIEILSPVYGYDLSNDTKKDYNGCATARFMAAVFAKDLKKQCDLHLKKKEIPHPE